MVNGMGNDGFKVMHFLNTFPCKIALNVNYSFKLHNILQIIFGTQLCIVLTIKVEYQVYSNLYLPQYPKLLSNV